MKLLIPDISSSFLVSKDIKIRVFTDYRPGSYGSPISNYISNIDDVSFACDLDLTSGDKIEFNGCVSYKKEYGLMLKVFKGVNFSFAFFTSTAELFKVEVEPILKLKLDA